VATEFFYFGSAAVDVPARFRSLLATTQGHKNTLEREKINRFWEWVENRAPKPGRIADPFEFTDGARRAQCGESAGDDLEEI